MRPSRTGPAPKDMEAAVGVAVGEAKITAFDHLFDRSDLGEDAGRQALEAIVGIIVGPAEVVDDPRNRLLLGGIPEVFSELVVLCGGAIGEGAAGGSEEHA